MRVSAFTTCHFDTQEAAARVSPSLCAWERRMRERVGADRLYLAMSCCFHPEWNPTEANIVNAHVPLERPYDPIRWCFFMCAVCAMLWHALNRDDWDVLLGFEHSTFINTANIKAMLDEFLNRPELIAAPMWCDCVEPGMVAWKKAAIVRFLNCRLRPNLCLEDTQPMLIEHELTRIFKGFWWNPWPGIVTTRQEYQNRWGAAVVPDEDVKLWPIIDSPTPTAIQTLNLL